MKKRICNRNKLKSLYKAHECTDVNDTIIAINALKGIAGLNYTPAMRRRLASLEKKKESFYEKGF